MFYINYNCYSEPKKHAQHSSTKQLKTILPKIADSLYLKQQFDMLLIDTVNPLTQPNLFRLLSVRLQRNLLANISSQLPSLVIKFNENVRWIQPKIWKLYLVQYFKQQSQHSINEDYRRSQMRNPLPALNILEDYLDPTKVTLTKQSWAKNSIRDIHLGIIILIYEFMNSYDANINFTQHDRFKWLQLLIGNLSDHYKDKLNAQQKKQAQSRYYDDNDDENINDEKPNQQELIKQKLLNQAKRKLIYGRFQLRSRVLGTISIVRNSSVDCGIRSGDFIWTFGRLGSNPMDKIHLAGKVERIFQIDNLNKLMPFLPTHLFPYNIFILMELWKPFNANDWNENTILRNIGMY